MIEYRIDFKLLQKVERLWLNGYKNEQQSIMHWLDSKGIVDPAERINKLKERILVKEDKPSNCYTYCRLLDKLRERSAEEIAMAIKGKPENLGCLSGHELIFETATRFNCIKSFRESLASINAQ